MSRKKKKIHFKPRGSFTRIKKTSFIYLQFLQTFCAYLILVLFGWYIALHFILNLNRRHFKVNTEKSTFEDVIKMNSTRNISNMYNALYFIKAIVLHQSYLIFCRTRIQYVWTIIPFLIQKYIYFFFKIIHINHWIKSYYKLSLLMLKTLMFFFFFYLHYKK